MTTQVKRWFQAAGMVAAAALAANAVSIYEMWQSYGVGGLVWQQLAQAVGQALVVLVLLALTRLAGRRLFGGRFGIAIGAVLLTVAAFVDDWITFHGATEGTVAIVYGMNGLIWPAAVPMIAGAWMLRSRDPHRQPHPVPGAGPVAADGSRIASGAGSRFAGVWDSPAGVLRLDPDGLFTLHRGGEPVEGSWDVAAGLPLRLLLTVDTPTAIGHGWETTALDVDHHPDGRQLLRVDQAGTAFARRPDEPAAEHTGGYVGRLEVLER